MTHYSSAFGREDVHLACALPEFLPERPKYALFAEQHAKGPGRRAHPFDPEPTLMNVSSRAPQQHHSPRQRLAHAPRSDQCAIHMGLERSYARAP